MTDAVLSVEGLWKRYDRRGAGAPMLKQALLDPFGHSRHRERFWALEDLNLSLGAGEAIGLIGANGSGKSTLLRLIGGLGKPTRGRIVRGQKVDAMLTLGESFDPLLTGRENAVTAGILAGYTRREITARLHEIAAFAELEEFFDHPLRTYSDGMKMRLAFSVAMSTEPEILLIDEVLAVGDLRFQSKCHRRLGELQARGVTILLASHDESQIRQVCRQVLWLSHGRMQAYGDPDEVYAAYSSAMKAETERRTAGAEVVARREAEEVRMHENRFGTLEVEIADVRVLREDRRVGVELELDPHAPVDDPIVSVSLRRVSDGSMVVNVNTLADGTSLGRIERPTRVALWLERLDVEAGSYRVDVGVYERGWQYVYDYHWQAYPLTVTPGGAGGTFGPSRRWSSREAS